MEQFCLSFLLKRVALECQCQILVGPQQDGLDGGHFSPVCRRQSQLKLLNLDAAVLGPDDVAVEIGRREAAEEYLNS